jgi:hypothetical protein
MARRYIMVRLQVFTMPPGLICPLCPVTYAPTQHALWQCPAQPTTRESLISNVAQRSEHAAAYMRTLDVAELTHFITGGRTTTYDPSLWHDLQTLYPIHLGRHRKTIYTLINEPILNRAHRRQSACLNAFLPRFTPCFTRHGT